MNKTLMLTLSFAALAMIAVPHASALPAIDPVEVDTPAGTFYILHDDFGAAGVAQESNGCAGFQDVDNAEECPAGTPADTVIFEQDFF